MEPLSLTLPLFHHRLFHPVISPTLKDHTVFPSLSLGLHAFLFPLHFYPTLPNKAIVSPPSNLTRMRVAPLPLKELTDNLSRTTDVSLVLTGILAVDIYSADLANREARAIRRILSASPSTEALLDGAFEAKRGSLGRSPKTTLRHFS
jgi:hypothetical protein